MRSDDLTRLNAAVQFLVLQSFFSTAIARLKDELANSLEPFVWSTVALNTVDVELPPAIKSCWIFHLKRGVPSGCHYHPNSVQHMIAINGHGTSRIGGRIREIIPMSSSGHSLEERWFVIRKGVRHEFFPADEDMTVVSFHTCEATELEEVACATGASRIYRAASAQ
jgi:hypothetical protein